MSHAPVQRTRHPNPKKVLRLLCNTLPQSSLVIYLPDVQHFSFIQHIDPIYTPMTKIIFYDLIARHSILLSAMTSGFNL